MNVKYGKYKHFKGKEYTVYGKATSLSGEEFVLYRQNYGDEAFWIRPIKMFYDKVPKDGGGEIPRFQFVSKIKATELIKAFIGIVKKESLHIRHSETGEGYRLVSIDEGSKTILVANNNTYSSYLTDSQLAFRMGYDMYNVDGRTVINKTCFDLEDDQKLSIVLADSEGADIEALDIIKDQTNPCSIDLHISDEFYRPRYRLIDMANTTHYSVMPQDPWKKVALRNIKGKQGVYLLPKQTLITYTMEKICLPKDCAGKIEIKSTYARLSLSVTASDFCNPGWRGHFPLTITNNGNHIIVLHPKEKMLQLSLVPTEAPIICRYSQKGVFMDDDGTPFKFWMSQTVKRMPSDLNPEKLREFYENALMEIGENSEDVESEQKRFQETFLRFCQRKLSKGKYAGIKDKEKRIHALWDAYKQRERTLRFFFSRPVKFSLPGIPIITALIPTFAEWYKEGALSQNTIKWLIIAVISAIVLSVVMFLKTPSCYCSFEKLEFNKIYKRK